jgi:hypothetical protein
MSEVLTPQVANELVMKTGEEMEERLRKDRRMEMGGLAIDWREILQRNGFTCEEKPRPNEPLAEYWVSRRSPNGKWIEVRAEDMFGGGADFNLAQWFEHTILQEKQIPAPASEECLVALMGEMGVPRGGGA